MIAYAESPQETTKHLLELTNEFQQKYGIQGQYTKKKKKNTLVANNQKIVLKILNIYLLINQD